MVQSLERNSAVNYKTQKEMDDAENEIINKRVNPELIKRQIQLETRLLEAEKAIKEREMDTKRKSKTALDISKSKSSFS